MSKVDFKKLAVSILAPFVAGGLGSMATASAIITWYAGLNKPPFNPPNWIFGPVWAFLYFLMGVSLYLVWNSNKEIRATRKAIIVFAIQLLLNTLWSVVFFGLQNPLCAFGIIIGLWLMIYLTIRKFYPISKTASYLLLPYLLWVSFATILNFWIVILN